MSSDRMRLYVWLAFAFCIVSLLVQIVSYAIVGSPISLFAGATNIGAALFSLRVLIRTRERGALPTKAPDSAKLARKR